MDMGRFEIGDYLQSAGEGFTEFVAEFMPNGEAGYCRLTIGGGTGVSTS